jgi:sec-independent protein translocase protein TatA
MGSFSIWHWLIVLVVVLVLFGGHGKISQLMGDFGKGLKNFRKSLKEDEPFEDEVAGAGRGEPKVLPRETPKIDQPARERDRTASP